MVRIVYVCKPLYVYWCPGCEVYTCVLCECVGALYVSLEETEDGSVYAESYIL